MVCQVLLKYKMNYVFSSTLQNFLRFCLFGFKVSNYFVNGSRLNSTIYTYIRGNQAEPMWKRTHFWVCIQDFIKKAIDFKRSYRKNPQPKKWSKFEILLPCLFVPSNLILTFYISLSSKCLCPALFIHILREKLTFFKINLNSFISLFLSHFF